MGHRKKKIRRNPFVLDEMGQSTYTVRGSMEQQTIWLRDPSAFLRTEPGIDLRDPLRTAYINGPEGEFRFVNPLEGAKINFIDPEPVMKPKTFLQKAKDFIMATMTPEFYTQMVNQAFQQYQRRHLVRSMEEMDFLYKREEELREENRRKQEEAAEKERKRKEALELTGVYRDRLKALTDENIALKYEIEQLKKKLV